MVNALASVGYEAKMPNGSCYLYVNSPKGAKGGKKFKTAEDASEYFITEKLVSTVPWDNAGHYLRFSATFKADSEGDEREVIGDMKERLADLELEF